MVFLVPLAVLVGFVLVAAAIVWSARLPRAGAGGLGLDAAGVHDQLQRLDRLVTALGQRTAEHHGTLAEQLRQVGATSASVAEHTDALRRALANPRQRGQWGERMADDVLAAAGLVEGVNFLRQQALPSGTVPDFRFLLPGDLEVRMDVKFPIDNYLRALEAETDAERTRCTRAFVGDVRDRIRELAGRGYVDQRDTVDCMLLFIPNEAVHAFLHDADRDVVDIALRHQVVLCSPSTLFAVLAVIRRSVEQFRLERATDEIVRCLGAVGAEWERFTGSLDKVSRQLDTLHRTFGEELNGTRRRVLEQTLARTERLPAARSDTAA